MEKNLGHATAYGYAKSKGYSGTEDEFAQLMADYASVGQSAAQSAEQAAASATSASGSAATAASAAQAATSKASEAVTAAWTAMTKASEASQSATSASQSAESAGTSAQTATTAATTAATKASEASESATTATAAKTDAETARDSAAQSASEAAESAKTLTIDNTLTKEGQAADAKETGDKIGAIDVTVNGVVSRNYIVGKGLYVYGTIHNIINDQDSCLSDYIPVTWGEGTKVGFGYTDDVEDTKQYHLWFLDENKEFVDSYVRNQAPNRFCKNLTTPVGAAYAMFSFKRGFAGYLSENSTAPSIYYYKAEDEVQQKGVVQNIGNLSELETEEKSSVVGAINEVVLSVPSDILPISPDKTNFFYVSGNLIDPEAWVDGEYVNQTNGAFAANSAHHRTGYINVDGGQSYCVLFFNRTTAVEIRYVFYDQNKEYISGELISLPVSGYVINAPDNAKYIVISNSAKSVPMMLKKSSELIPFEDYDNTYILEKFIRNSDVGDVVINLPKNIYALVGYETNIYFENIVNDWTKYEWDISCSKGKQYERGFKITPEESDVGTYTLSIKISVDDTAIKTVTTSLIITSASAGENENVSVIILGDSTTNNGTVITKLNKNLAQDVMSISTLGTRGTSPNNHEGRSGWRLETYFTVESIDYTDGRGHVENPFYNPTTQTFDADYYFTNSGIAKPDWFVINMGINDMFSYETGAALDSAIETCIGYVDSMIASVKSASPSSKIGVCLTIPPNHSQDAFGKAYSNGQTRYRYKKNNTIWVNRLISEYDNRESEDIYLIPIHTNLDTVYNMGMETLPVNARNTTVTYQSPISSGGVHPVESGYWQIADVYTAFLKAHAED